MSTQIPDGYELLAGRNKKNAIQALATAEERGLAPETVLTTTDGYLIPVGEFAEVGEVDVPDSSWSVADIEKFAEEWNIDLSEAKNKSEKLAAIEAEIERRTVDAENGNLDESKKED